MGKFRVFVIASVLILLLVPVLARAQITDFSISWWTLGGGGRGSSGSDYSLRGTIGQPSADSLQGGDYNLGGGFWGSGGGGTQNGETRVYLPLVVR